MRILHIPNYYNPHIGGIEQVTEDIVNSISKDYEQKIICFKDAKKTTIDYINGVEVIRVGCQTKVASQSIALGYKKELNKIMKEFNPDIVIFHYPNPFVASALRKHLNKKTFKFILYWHLDITKQKVLGKLFNGQTKMLLKKADRIIATSPNYIEGSKFLTENKEKTIVIPNCVNDSKFEYDDSVKNIVEKIKLDNLNKKIIFTCGRHVEYKGLTYLIEAAKYLSDDYVVYIGGKGPLTESLKEEAKKFSNVVFLGKLSEDDLKAYTIACDVYAFPSITKNEAFGLALAEALGYGKPAVTFTIDGSGVNYVNLNGETGIEVPNGDSKAFAEALKELCNNEALNKSYGENAKARVKENFTFDTFKKNINNLLEEVSNEKNSNI